MNRTTQAIPVPTAIEEPQDQIAGEAETLELWQIEEIKQAVIEADARDFAPEDEVTSTMQRYAH